MSKGKSERTMQMKQDREAGMTCREIAEKYGVSHQWVHSVVGRYSPERFRYVKEQACVYPNLRNWMNANKVGKREMLRRMGLEAYPKNSTYLYTVMTGRRSPRKTYIDRMLQVTGMTYEELFYTEVQDG